MKEKRVTNKGLGFIPDPTDERDFLFKSVKKNLFKAKKIVKLPESVDLRDLMSEIRDQGEMSSCTAFAVSVGLMESIEIEHFKSPMVPLSPLFLYYNTREFQGAPNEDNGATLRDTMRMAAKLGVCAEKTWPYSMNRVFSEPPSSAYREAGNRSSKIKTYYRVAGLNEIKQALAARNPVVLGLMLYESFQSEEVAATGIVPMPNTSKESLVGGHAVCAVGYDNAKSMVLIRNSWGSGWGEKGYCWVPYGYFKNPDLACDMWTAVN